MGEGSGVRDAFCLSPLSLRFGGRGVGGEGGGKMDQVFEGTPKATLKLEGRKVTRSEVTNDWGTRLQWKVLRDGKVVATPLARMEAAFEHADQTAGTYEVVLELWKYEGYRAGCQGKYVEISNRVSYKI